MRSCLIVLRQIYDQYLMLLLLLLFLNLPPRNLSGQDTILESASLKAADSRICKKLELII